MTTFYDPAVQSGPDGPLSNHFRARVNALRGRGISDAEIAKAAGISPKYLYNSVKYSNNMRSRTASRLAAAVAQLEAGGPPLSAAAKQQDPVGQHVAALRGLGYTVILLAGGLPLTSPGCPKTEAADG
jgi:hypothetical protein